MLLRNIANVMQSPKAKNIKTDSVLSFENCNTCKSRTPNKK